MSYIIDITYSILPIIYDSIVYVIYQILAIRYDTLDDMSCSTLDSIYSISYTIRDVLDTIHSTLYSRCWYSISNVIYFIVDVICAFDILYYVLGIMY